MLPSLPPSGSTFSGPPALSCLCFFLFRPKYSPFTTPCRLYIFRGFLRFFVSSPFSPILSFVSSPWALVLRMMRRYRWGLGSCGYGCCLLVGVAPSFASSDPPLILRREQGQGKINFPCSADQEQDWQPYPRLIHTLPYVMAIHTYYLFVGSQALSPLHPHFCSRPVLALIPALVLIPLLVLVIPAPPSPIPVPITVPPLPSLVLCSPLGTTSSGRWRVLYPEPPATCRLHLLSIEMMLSKMS